MFLNGGKIFITGLLSSKPIIQIWVSVLILFNAIAPFLFLNELAAQVALIGAFSGSVIACVMSTKTGYNKYLGLMHGPWVPIVWVNLYTLFTYAEINYWFYMWLIGSSIVTSISLIIDFFDVASFHSATANTFKSS